MPRSAAALCSGKPSTVRQRSSKDLYGACLNGDESFGFLDFDLEGSLPRGYVSVITPHLYMWQPCFLASSEVSFGLDTISTGLSPGTPVPNNSIIIAILSSNGQCDDNDINR